MLRLRIQINLFKKSELDRSRKGFCRVVSLKSGHRLRKSKSMSRRQLERLLQIDHLLRTKQRCIAQTLADVVEVSERTVREDIAFLRDRYQAPIACNRQRGYFYTDPDWRLPTILLTQGELFALTLGARMLEACSGTAYVMALRSAIARLAERLPEETWVDLQQVADERIIFRSGAE